MWFARNQIKHTNIVCLAAGRHAAAAADAGAVRAALEDGAQLAACLNPFEDFGGPLHAVLAAEPAIVRLKLQPRSSYASDEAYDAALERARPANFIVKLLLKHGADPASSVECSLV